MGFLIAQIDAPDKDWCKRPGEGFIRELYVAPRFRKRGLASAMIRQAEQDISAAGARRIYLETQVPTFWARMGYLLSGKRDLTNGREIYEKLL